MLLLYPSCLSEKEDPVLMVIGGYPSQYFHEVEVVPMGEASRDLSCTKPSRFPLPRGHVATFISGRPLVCNGEDLSSKDCYWYDWQSNSWITGPEMKEIRHG